MLGTFVEQHYGENMVVNQFFDALSDTAEQLFAVENGGDLAADVVQQGKRVGLLGVRDKQARGDGISFTHQRKWSEFGGFIHIRSIRRGT